MLFNGLLTLACALTANAISNPDGLTVSTQQGDVVGTLVSHTVRRFLGVPFAVAGRWAAPTGPPIRTAPLTASNFGDSCLQALNAGAVEFLKLAGLSNFTVVPESENCLTVNIWTPSIQRKQATAVMIWVYGGGFGFGTSNLIVYDGQNIIRDNDDVLIVTFNYRLNIFGQPNAPQLASTTNSQNFGLLDLDAVVQWVHGNIAAFGGDPARIVLFGESAGAVAIDAYTYMHPQDTIVKGVIQQSGSLSGVVSTNTTINATAWNTVAAAVGCGTTNDAAQLTCMKAVPFRKLEDAVISTNTGFGPISDNITVFADYRAHAASGNFLKAPLFIGSNENEGDIFVIAQELLTLGVAPPVVTQLLSDAVTQAFTCSASNTAADRVRVGVPTWRYQYQAIFPDISSRPDLRAYHSSEIPLVFGTYVANPSPPPTTIEIAFGKYVQGAWVAFARDPVHGLSNYGWPLYNPITSSLVQLGGFFNQTGTTFGPSILLDATCNTTATLTNILLVLLDAAASIHL